MWTSQGVFLIRLILIRLIIILQGKLGDKINDECQEYTCSRNSDGTLDWEVTGVKDDCRQDRGRNRCKRPYVCMTLQYNIQFVTNNYV